MSHPLLERWSRDADFRHALRTAPAATVKRAGVPMTEGQWDALRSVDWSLPERDLLALLESAFLAREPEDTRLVRP